VQKVQYCVAWKIFFKNKVVMASLLEKLRMLYEMKVELAVDAAWELWHEILTFVRMFL
jgi:hypothetical protein